MNQSSVYRIIVLSGILFIAIVLMQACGIIASAKRDQVAQSSPVSLSLTPTLWHEYIDLSRFPPEKQEKARHDLATVEALTGPLPTPVTVSPVGEGYYPAGAGTLYEEPFYPHPGYAKDYIFQNHWRTKTTTETIAAYAGCFRDNPEQGFVHVEYKAPIRPNPEPFTRPSATVSSPISAGCLKVVGADGMRLFLVTSGVSATQEISLTFDVSSATFVP